MFKIFKTKSQKTKAIQLTIELLAAYHALPLDNELFRKQYKHLFSLLSLYTKRT